MGLPVRARLAFLAIPVLATIACQFLVSSDVYQCSSDNDCLARAPDYPSCVNRVCVGDAGAADAASETAPPVDAGDSGDGAVDPFGCANDVPPEPQPGKRVQYTRFFYDATSSTALTDITVEVCARFDVNCNSPRAQDGGTGPGSAWLTPDSSGQITVDVEFGFDGLLQVTDKVDGGNSVQPALIQVSPPVFKSRTGPPALMVSPGLFDTTAKVVFPGVGADPTLAHVFFRTHDCFERSLADIHMKFSTNADPKTKPFYFSGFQPDPGADHTDASGRGGFLNLKPGSTTLTGTFASTGKKLGQVDVQLRAGFVTYVIITPTQ